MYIESDMYIVMGAFLAVPGLIGLFSTLALLDGDNLFPQSISVLICACFGALVCWMYVAGQVANSYNVEATGADVMGAWLFGAFIGFVIPWIGYGAGLLLGLVLVGLWRLPGFFFRKVTRRTTSHPKNVS